MNYNKLWKLMIDKNLKKKDLSGMETEHRIPTVLCSNTN